VSRQPVSTEYSAGGLVYRKNGTSYDIVVVQRARHEDWSLPKGHIEGGESKEEAALREVEEETGLEAGIVCSLGEIVYFYRRPKEGLTRKTVYHFLMEALGDELGPPNWEVSEVRWVPINEAHTLLTYKNDLEIIGKAKSVLGIASGPGTGHPTAKS
jgi:8-oxo-dGTP pyrophosphatase MutT (NUDIX family)